MVTLAERRPDHRGSHSARSRAARVQDRRCRNAHLEWDKVVSVVAATRQVEVVTTDGRRFLGTLGPGRPVDDGGHIRGHHIVSMSEVTMIAPIGTSFWRQARWLGRFRLQLHPVERRRSAQRELGHRVSQARVSFGVHRVVHEDATGRRRGRRQRPERRRPWIDRGVTFCAIHGRVDSSPAGAFETNESLGLTLRSQLGRRLGPRLVNTNRAR